MVLRDLGGRSRVAALAAVAALVLGPVLAGCGDDEGSPSTTSPPAASVPPAASDGPADPAAAKAEITRNWKAFFDPKTPVNEKAKLLENGAEMMPVLAAFAGDRNAAMTSATVKTVEFTSPTGANVTYDLVVGGTPALPDTKGTAVQQNDVWKVSVKTLCGLVELSGANVPGC
ncbi:hypothetical protein ACIGBL_32510 [Streptomyces sp. NPDC085614]|uniref:hypothetical protein n=1 Tax=unclassified Streptomyces TaxID=2593676 RepID=UPI0021C805A7|nr:hypothetical protein [Streptomyces sp. ms191]